MTDDNRTTIEKQTEMIEAMRTQLSALRNCEADYMLWQRIALELALWDRGGSKFNDFVTEVFRENL